ncbi:hypothetical protein [Desulfobotulus sp.]|uniref:hypothetical protein n=1 Tax=Desulfobotulus sp. TaxID=1940337 RepID=UPI002A371247|nr:hypothetical protein [Desulfobotulus sp.]MDY0164458.1 hypothetical protein [Desulfobotulus sp.]
MTREHLRIWVLHHDDRWSFILLYLTLAVCLSIWISLFWLVVVVAFHGALEWICQREADGEASWPELLGRVLWSIKLDISLIVFSLVLGVYMEIIMGVAGLGSATRAGVQGMKSGARFMVWENVLRAVLLSLDDLAQVLRALFRKPDPESSKKLGREREILERRREERERASLEPVAHWRGVWTAGDWFCLSFGAFCLILLLVSPWATGHGLGGVWRLLILDLHPWPG